MPEGLWDHVREVWWLTRHGAWYFGWEWPLRFALLCTWYDGPIYLITLGFFQIGLYYD